MANEEIKTNKITGSSLLHAKCNKKVIQTLASMETSLTSRFSKLQTIQP